MYFRYSTVTVIVEIGVTNGDTAAKYKNDMTQFTLPST